MAIDFGAIGTIVAIGGLGAWQGIREYQAYRKAKHEEEMSKRYGIKDNPTRCGEHEDRLRLIDTRLGGLETRAAVLDTKVTSLEKCADEIKDDVADIRNRLK
jgi:hypothetical protein